MSLKNSVTPPGIDPWTVRLVAERLNHYATPGHLYIYIYIYINVPNVLTDKAKQSASQPLSVTVNWDLLKI